MCVASAKGAMAGDAFISGVRRVDLRLSGLAALGSDESGRVAC